MNVQSQFGERTNERLQQVIADRQSNPVKPIEPIEAQKKVKSCPFSWTDESAKERVKYCDTCERAIYNFDGLELEQAKALILTRENRVKFVLHERPDGKFMTSDCPIAQRKRFQVVGLVAGAFIGVVALVAAFILIGPTSQPPVSNNNEVTAPAPATTADADSSASNPPGTVTHHYEAGDPMPVVPPSEPAKKNTEPSFSAQEQKGEFWQFPNGQPADDFSRRPGASAEQ